MSRKERRGLDPSSAPATPHNMGKPFDSSEDSVPSDTRAKTKRPPSPVPSCASMKSNMSMTEPFKFSGDNNPSDTRCGVCEQELAAIVSMSCGHSFCKDCVSNPLDQPGQLGQHMCLQCNGDTLQLVMRAHKTTLKRRFEGINEGAEDSHVKMSLKKIYTELYITEGESEGVNTEHEIQQIRREFKRKTLQETAIKCNDIFKPLPGQNKIIQTVLTKGIAGIGKTVSVHKFILDWTEGNGNEDIDFMFILPFREMNLVKNRQFSLHDLVVLFHPEVKRLDPKIYQSCKVLFIFDGLDESRLEVNFKAQHDQSVSSVSDVSSLSTLITKLFHRNILPSALIWVTSRPAAAAQIPSQRIDQVTEVRGFNHPQKEEYFRKRISDESQASRIISHVKSSRSLYIMCHIPVFCWITAAVLSEIFVHNINTEIPTTLTEMFAHFLLIQTNVKSQKYHGKNESDKQRLLQSNKNILMKLAKLAYEQLEKGNILFYEEDIIMCGIDVADASVYTGMCTEIFREEPVFGQRRVYCFVHLSIQEFLAAVYVFSCSVNADMEALSAFPTMGVNLHHWLVSAVDRALKSENGHLDLFLRFLLGCALESNQRLLQGILPKTQDFSESIRIAVEHIKKKISENVLHHKSSPQRYMNLLLCLMEMKDNSAYSEIQQDVNSGKKISVEKCSALAYMLLMSDDVLDEFDLSKYNTSEDGHNRLLTAVSTSRKANLASCSLNQYSCTILTNAIQSPESHLTELNLTNNRITDKGISSLFGGLTSRYCKILILRLAACDLTHNCCHTLSSVLQHKNSSLKELDLSFNHLTDSGIQLMCAGLVFSGCKLETLRLKCCDLTEESCKILGWAVNTNLKMLDLTNNEVGDCGAKSLSLGLKHPCCKLENLILSGCLITEIGCDHLTSALDSNPLSLRELDLSYNHPGVSGVKKLTSMLKNTDYKLEKLNTEHNSARWLKPGLQKYTCELTLDPDTASPHLLFSEGNRKVTYVFEKQPYSDNMKRFDSRAQVLCSERLTTRCYWEADFFGRVYIAVAYNSIKRRGREESIFGSDDKSWRMSVNLESSWPAFWHNKKMRHVTYQLNENRLGVYLDWPAGTLSFYSVSLNTLKLLNMYHSTFTEPLHAAFGVYNNGNRESSISLCSVPNRIQTTYNDGGMEISADEILCLNHRPTNCCKSCENIKDTSHWILMEPSVSMETGVPVYKHSSPPGRFECTVSGLRWVCAVEVTLEYCFSDPDIFRAELAMLRYTPIGPLMDIKVLSGELLEAHLPHFACLEGSYAYVREAVRVLHGDDSGVTLKTCELTRFHTKLLKPSFSLTGAILKKCFRIKTHLDVLIYRTRVTPLVLLAYVVPRDASMIQAVEKDLPRTQDAKEIKTHRPDMSIQMNTKFRLNISPCHARISPSEITLKYIRPPDLFRVVIDNAEDSFDLEILSEGKSIWRATLERFEYGETGEMAHSHEMPSAAAHRHSREEREREVANTSREEAYSSSSARNNEVGGIMATMSHKDRLFCIRPDLIERTSEPTLKGLVLRLESHQPPVLNRMEAQVILQRTSVLHEQVTSLIDMVVKKGDTTCGIMLSLLKELDYYFYQDLIKKTLNLS
ncbi:hypothetical protein AALO_G00094490 [Alosa alosa]|uniref:NACHT, LRR and PYD domains-containing protein 12-like n=1 Tax=Alosa alosa TaxID=278164 RepID=A0AAV6GWK6_9TELE|nr:NACHT, LRR and PYD domains-containing protein 12-like [Alosa alosa]KAG5278037.1 hypothetical protein AALO_G00094490 [Alosa alosa]